MKEIDFVESSFDKRFLDTPIGIKNRHKALHLASTASEDLLRGILSFGSQLGATFSQLVTLTDMQKYSVKHCFDRIYQECDETNEINDHSKIEWKTYRIFTELIAAGKDYETARKICTSVRSGQAKIVAEGSRYKYESISGNAQYSTLEMIPTDQEDDEELNPALFPLLLHQLVNTTRAESDGLGIADRVRINSNGFLEYEIHYPIINQLKKIKIGDWRALPEDWTFPWTKTSIVIRVIDALLLLCYYHAVSIHFGSIKYRRPDLGMNSICLVISHNDLIEKIQSFCGLQKNEIESVIGILRYGNGTKNPDPTVQPLVQINDSEYLVQCIQLISSNHARNILTLHARFNKNDFDSKSKIFETRMTQKLLSDASKKWKTIATNRHIPGEKSAGDLDMVILDAENRTVLILELRWMIPPGDASEIINRKKACIEKQRKIQRKVEAFRARLRESLHEIFQIKKATHEQWNIQGIIVIDGYGGVASDIPEFPVMPAWIVSRALQLTSNLPAFSDWARSLNWLPQNGVHFNTTMPEIPLNGERTLVVENIELQSSIRDYVDHLDSSLRGFSIS